MHYYEICLLTDGLDYSVVNMGLTLSESLPRQCVDINITGDDVLEGNEMFRVQIESSVSRVTTAPNSVVVTIRGILYNHLLLLLLDKELDRYLMKCRYCFS